MVKGVFGPPVGLLRKEAIKEIARPRDGTFQFQTSVEIAQIRPEIPSRMLFKVALGIERSLRRVMEEVATGVSNTGTMANSVKTHIDYPTERMIVHGMYMVPYEEFVDTGTGPSLGRYVIGLTPREWTPSWDGRGARLSTKNLKQGRVYGWHPGTPAHRIWDQIESRMEEYMDVIEATLADDFRFWYDGHSMKDEGDYMR